MLTVNAIIVTTIILDIGIQSVIIDRILRAKQKKQRREEVEEENLTRYESNTSSDQPKGWEFKPRIKSSLISPAKLYLRVRKEYHHSQGYQLWALPLAHRHWGRHLALH